MVEAVRVELTEPSVGALDDPAALVSSELSAVFILPLLAVLAVRNDEVDASLLQPFSQRVAAVAAAMYITRNVDWYAPQ